MLLSAENIEQAAPGKAVEVRLQLPQASAKVLIRIQPCINSSSSSGCR